MGTVGDAHEIRVLVVEEQVAARTRVQNSLSEAAVARFELEFVTTVKEAIERLADLEFNVVMLDLDAPDAHGLDAVLRLQAYAPSVPIVIHGGCDDETVARAAVNMGVQDCIVDGWASPTLLARALRYSVDRHRAVTDLQRARAALAASLEETKRMQERDQEASRRIAEMMQAKNDLVGIVSHDLRTPLTVIGGYAYRHLRRAGSQLDAATRECLEIIVRHVDQMSALIADMLTLSAIDADALQLDVRPFDLAALVRKHAPSIVDGTGRRLGLTIADDCPDALGDPRRHQQILSNLITNAVKFAPEDSTVQVRVTRRADFVAVSVRDRGPGIVPELMPRLFKRFSAMPTGAAVGQPSTGLGLYIVKTLVDAQGGSIEVRTKPGTGTTFTYTAPIAEAAAAPRGKEPAAASVG